MKKDKTLTIIPAKLGSKRLPKKNIRKLCGKPLINYTIEAAIASGKCGRIMVSTESKEVAEIAKIAGAEIPFFRPVHLGSDPYGVVDVCLNVLEMYDTKGMKFEKLIILLPTSPFRSAVDIVDSNSIFEENKGKFLMSVTETDANLFSVLKKKDEESNVMVPCFPSYAGKKRNEMGRLYSVNGAVCILDVESFRKEKTYYGKPLLTYEMPWWRGIDINTEIEFQFAEFLLEKGFVKKQ